jgi:hypothetical protein
VPKGDVCCIDRYNGRKLYEAQPTDLDCWDFRVAVQMATRMRGMKWRKPNQFILFSLSPLYSRWGARIDPTSQQAWITPACLCSRTNPPPHTPVSIVRITAYSRAWPGYVVYSYIYGDDSHMAQCCRSCSPRDLNPPYAVSSVPAWASCKAHGGPSLDALRRSNLLPGEGTLHYLLSDFSISHYRAMGEYAEYASARGWGCDRICPEKALNSLFYSVAGPESVVIRL